MKVLTINGSPNPHGCTARALTELEQALAAEGVETAYRNAHACRPAVYPGKPAGASRFQYSACHGSIAIRQNRHTPRI